MKTFIRIAITLLLLSGAARAEALGNSTCNAGAGTLSQDIYQAYLADTSRNGFSASMSSTQQAMVCSQVWAFVQFMATLVTPINAVVISDSSSNNPLQVSGAGPRTTIQSRSGVNSRLASNNTFLAGTNDTYFANGYAGLIDMPSANGDFLFLTAPSGTAGTSATFTTRFRILNGGNGIFGTVPSTGLGLLTVTDGSRPTSDPANNGNSSFAVGTNGGSYVFGVHMGYDTTNHWSWIQSIEPGVSVRTLHLNNSGGDVTIGQNLVSIGTVFAGLGAPANGTIIYCSNCTIANPCAAAGTGAFAKRLNGIWVCN